VNPLVNVIIITAVAGIGGTGIGGIIGAFFGKNSEKIVSLLLSFAAGVMTAVVCFDLLVEALNQKSESTLHLLFVILATAFGYGIIYALNAWIDKKTNPEVPHIDKDHPKTADHSAELIHIDHYNEHKKSKSGLFVAGLIMACAIALHNLPEGMVLGASYVTTGAGTVAISSSLALAIVIGLHNIPEGMSISVPLVAGGTSRLMAILVTAATGIPTVLGAILGYSIGSMGSMALALSLGFASGAMLYVVFGELIPEALLMWRSKTPATAMLVGVLVGMLIIFI
jgi:ZIP family zinc transporter